MNVGWCYIILQKKGFLNSTILPSYIHPTVPLGDNEMFIYLNYEYKLNTYTLCIQILSQRYTKLCLWYSIDIIGHSSNIVNLGLVQNQLNFNMRRILDRHNSFKITNFWMIIVKSVYPKCEERDNISVQLFGGHNMECWIYVCNYFCLILSTFYLCLLSANRPWLRLSLQLWNFPKMRLTRLWPKRMKGIQDW